MNELSVLEKIVPTLQPGEQYHAVLAILWRYEQAKDWDKAWSLYMQPIVSRTQPNERKSSI